MRRWGAWGWSRLGQNLPYDMGRVGRCWREVVGWEEDTGPVGYSEASCQGKEAATVHSWGDPHMKGVVDYLTS